MKAKKSLTPKEFKRQFAEFSERAVNEVAIGVVAGVTRAVYEGIVKRNPVLTGQSRNSWGISMDTPDFPRRNGPGPVKTTGKALVAEEKARLAEAIASIRTNGLGGVIWISNGQPYIGLLEAGRSPKAPAGMVAVTVNEVVQKGVRIKIVNPR